MSLPEIGTEERGRIERAAIETADEMLGDSGNFYGALRCLHAVWTEHRGYDAATHLIEHVEQVWIGRVLK